MDENGRDYRFDNLKALLIFVVVFTHTFDLHPALFSNPVMYSIYSVMWSFAMPVFIFISGYFTRSVPDSKKALTNILIPFLVFNTFYWAVSTRNLGGLLTTQYAMWYLLSLFSWRLIVIPLSKLRFSFVFSVLASLYIGCIPKATNFLSVQRTIAFFRFSWPAF